MGEAVVLWGDLSEDLVLESLRWALGKVHTASTSWDSNSAGSDIIRSTAWLQ